ncbi:MAG TPA: GNAT family protein [Candidatus Lustribacter sp.]|nr:GNAT family protein [Candidatus Lustribacter sp.]
MIVLRPLRRRDRDEWFALRAANTGWTRPWEPSSPMGAVPQVSFTRYVRSLDADGRTGASLTLAIEVGLQIIGQIQLFGVARGSLQSSAVGYWVAQHMGRQGIAPRAVAMVVDHAFGAMGLHRVEVNIRPDNVFSLRVVEKLGLRDEGLRERFLHIDGVWRDHRSFALTADELGDRPLRDRLRGLP